MGQQILTPKARPRAYSAYNIELGAQVCEAIANGMLVHEIAQLPGMGLRAKLARQITSQRRKVSRRARPHDVHLFVDGQQSIERPQPSP